MPSKPTDKELEILDILWSQGPSTVRFVNDNLQSNKEVGYTTTLKLMQIMFEKGLVSREKSGKTHIYKAEITRDSTQKTMVGDLMNAVFQGSAKQLVMQVLGNRKTTEKELEEIKNFIEQIKKERE